MGSVSRALVVIGLVGCLGGCAMMGRDFAAGAARPKAATSGADTTEVRSDRMLIWSASLTVEVWDVGKALAEATALAEQQGGFVERKSDAGEESASVTLRIPTKAFKAAVAGLEALGRVTYRNVDAEDVTEQYIDVDARLKNKIALRDRLKQLLEKAQDVKDILAIENELNRVQSDIDSMEGRLKALKGQVDLATVRLTLERKPILGPLGYVFKGLFWCVGKLFVIRN